ncbi:MAG: hypothetical protein M0R74_01225 [Dehalococcoidia bacterium]|nr:hypothetical protein [Dehalococcoidia bacterium]
MYTAPTTDDLIEGVIIALERDILPACTSQKAQVGVVMAQAVLQMARQMIPVQLQYMCEEHNQMTSLFREIGELIGDTPGPEADRIRELAQKFGNRQQFPVVPPTTEVMESHRELAQGLVDAIRNLDVLIVQGNDGANQAILRFREQFGPRIARDFATMVAGAGMAGRG